MKRSLIPLSILCGAMAASGAALADHNSKNGEGWANMPNDIHNTRIETRETDDNEAFRDFVKYGEGSTSENRFTTDETVPAQAAKQQGKAQQVQSKVADKARNESRTSVRTNDRARTETRSRIHRDPSMSSQRERSATGNRGGGRKGGGKR